MGFSMLSLTLPPGDNVLGLESDVLSAAQYSMGAMLYILKSYPIPSSARYLTRLIYGHTAPSNTAARLMLFGNFMLAIVVPLATIIYTNQDCFAGWMALWRQCDNARSFDTSVQGVIGSFSYPSQGYINLTTGFFEHHRTAEISIAVTVTTHDEVCHPRYIADGRCPRAVVSSLGELYTKDLCFSIGLGTILSFLRATPHMKRTKQWLMRKVCRQHEYEPKVRADRFVTSAALLMELPLVLGFLYPILPALAAAAMMLNAGVFHFAMSHFGTKMHEDPPPRVALHYLWGSLTLGCTLPTWLFWEGDFAGKWVMPFGPLLSIVLAKKAWYAANNAGDREHETPHEAFMRRKYMSGTRRRSPLGVDDPLWVPKQRLHGCSGEDDVLPGEQTVEAAEDLEMEEIATSQCS